ncbi:MAG: flagellar basal body L-ring protein FlgH [Vampirovibrionales bacterium]
MNPTSRFFVMALLLSSLLNGIASVQAESLYLPNTEGMHPRANAPRMLYSPPRPQQIGDLVTIKVEESTKRQNKNTIQIQKDSTFNENTSTVLSNAASTLANTFGVGGLARFAQLPNLGGIVNNNVINNQGTATQNQSFNDTFTCQVVQVLPNGNLMVQGRKTMAFSKEKTDVYVTGIVNPYFLNSENEISSQKVANMQIVVAGQGIISRSQNDSIFSKIMSKFQ